MTDRSKSKQEPNVVHIRNRLPSWVLELEKLMKNEAKKTSAKQVSGEVKSQ